MRPCSRMTELEIQNTTLRIVQGRIFAATQLPPTGILDMVFMSLALGGLGDVDPDTIGNIIEDLDRAIPDRGINGFPIFMSHRLVHKEDWDIIVGRATKAHEALNTVLAGES